MTPARLRPPGLRAGRVECVAHSVHNPPTAVDKVPMQDADLKKLEDELHRLGLAGFRRIREEHPKDHFYCFAFYSNGEFTYAALTASTYEGLDRVTHDYMKKPPYNAMTIEDLRLDLKWSPDDSPLHGAPEDILTALDPLMEAVTAELRRRSNLKDDWKSFDEFVTQVSTCFANALRRIDTDGAFGRGEERKQVVVNFLMGDQSDENRIGFAERVNPVESVKMLKQDLEAARRLRR